MFVLFVAPILLNTVLCLQEGTFEKNDLCDLEDRVLLNCSRKTASNTSLIRCASVCNLDALCVGASVDEDMSCFNHNSCPSLEGVCNSVAGDHDYFSKKMCLHGTWSHSNLSCICDGLYHGDKCDKYPKGCSTLLNAGYPSGRHILEIDPLENGHSVRVVCDVSTPSYTAVLLMRNRGNINFNRTMSEYEAGFYIDGYNFWMGFDTWRTLSQAGYVSIFTINFAGSFGKANLHRTYPGLKIEDKARMFKISSIGSMRNGGSQPALNRGLVFGDCLGPIQGRPFSTWDMDSDGDVSNNCASRAGSGWWYGPGCDNPCNMLGKGFHHWSNVPDHQRIKVPEVDMLTWASDIHFMEIYLR